MKIYDENETTNDFKEVKIITPVDTLLFIISSINNSRGLMRQYLTTNMTQKQITVKLSEHMWNIYF